jgi:hypothetical protein
MWTSSLQNSFQGAIIPALGLVVKKRWETIAGRTFRRTPEAMGIMMAGRMGLLRNPPQVGTNVGLGWFAAGLVW